MISRRLAHDGHGRVAVIHGGHRRGVRAIWSRVGAHLPITSTIVRSGPTVVFLVGGNVCAIGIAFHDASRGICQNHRLIFALVYPEIGIEVSATIEVACLRLPATNDGQESVGRNNGPRRDFKLGGVVNVIRHVPATEVYGRRRLVEQLHEILVVARHIQRVIGARKLIDDHLRSDRGIEAASGQ